MTDTPGPTAVAWSLYKPPYMSAGGNRMNQRHVWIMVIDRYVVKGFGVEGPRCRTRYTVTYCGTPKTAHRHAVTETQRREREGFLLGHGPVTKATKAGSLDHLAGYVGHRGPHDKLDTDLAHILANGVPLAA